VDQSLHKVPAVEVVRKAQLDLAGRIQPFNLRCVELQIQTGEVVPELLQPSGPNDRDDGDRPLSKPGKGNLGRRTADFSGDRLDLVHDSPGTLVGPVEALHHFFEVALFRRVWAQRGASSFLRIWAK